MITRSNPEMLLQIPSDRSFGGSGRISATHPWADGPTQVEVLGHGTRLRKAAESIHAADGTGISIRPGEDYFCNVGGNCGDG